jgi:asparagine synthase (glutamine-hydrolysing)
MSLLGFVQKNLLQKSEGILIIQRSKTGLRGGSDVLRERTILLCGICGYITERDSLPPLEKMVQSLKRRGPDGSGVFRSQNARVGLGSTRLAIVGLDSGAQPLYSRDHHKVLVCNGEIYNASEWRGVLEKEGYFFQTESDCEVILALYEKYGESFISHLNGMFSLALWDDRLQKLILARDRMGQKPLYYYHENGVFLFGSEPKSLLAAGIPVRVDFSALDQFLSYQVLPQGGSVYQGVQQLPPAYSGVYEKGSFRKASYFSLEAPPLSSLSLPALLQEALRIRIPLEVSYGVYLSGGLDSSLMLALLAKESTQKQKTFSIGFEQAGYNELPFARIVAQHFQTDHHEKILGAEALESLETLIEMFDEPFGDSSAIACHFLSQMAKASVKVAITGDGGDELFYGYPRYQAVKLVRALYPFTFILEDFIEAMPVSLEPKSRGFRLKKLLSGGRLPLAMRYSRWNCPLTLREKEALYTPVFLECLGRAPQERFFSSECRTVRAFARQEQQHYLPDDILVKVDRTSMYHGVECRSPFMDYRVVLAANGLPDTLKMRGLEGKYILKKYFENELMLGIRKRKKMGFGIPLAAWLRKESRTFCRDYLLSSRLKERQWFRPEIVLRWIEEHEEGKQNHAERLWLLLNIEIWAQKYLEG